MISPGAIEKRVTNNDVFDKKFIENLFIHNI